jgi:hypothetical protein
MMHLKKAMPLVFAVIFYNCHDGTIGEQDGNEEALKSDE